MKSIIFHTSDVNHRSIKDRYNCSVDLAQSKELIYGATCTVATRSPYKFQTIYCNARENIIQVSRIGHRKKFRELVSSSAFAWNMRYDISRGKWTRTRTEISRRSFSETTKQVCRDRQIRGWTRLKRRRRAETRGRKRKRKRRRRLPGEVLGTVKRTWDWSYFFSSSFFLLPRQLLSFALPGWDSLSLPEKQEKEWTDEKRRAKASLCTLYLPPNLGLRCKSKSIV